MSLSEIEAAVFERQEDLCTAFQGPVRHSPGLDSRHKMFDDLGSGNLK